MNVRCEKCGRVYDDAIRWTICPHNPLERPWNDPYCREHDLFHCTLEHTIQPVTSALTADAIQQWAHNPVVEEMDGPTLHETAAQTRTAFLELGELLVYYSHISHGEALEYMMKLFREDLITLTTQYGGMPYAP